MLNQEKLDQLTLDIEFLLISVIQGVALAGLAGASSIVVSNLVWEYWPYILTGFILILIFWCGAIIHAISFIRWPFDLMHSFLYFLTSFIEVLAFSQIENPLYWFGVIFLFQIAALAMYIYDLRMIKNAIQSQPRNKVLYDHILSQQRYELTYFLPASLLFNLLAFLAIYLDPQFFIDQKFHLGLIALQLLFSLIFLRHEMQNFKTRITLIDR